MPRSEWEPQIAPKPAEIGDGRDRRVKGRDAVSQGRIPGGIVFEPYTREAFMAPRNSDRCDLIFPQNEMGSASIEEAEFLAACMIIRSN